RCRHTIRRTIHWFVSAKKLITSPAASAQKVYILHKKPSLSGTLCAKPSYGVPQHRERVFIVASSDGKQFKFPMETHGDLEPYRTAWDALGDLPERLNDSALKVGGKWAELLPSIPEGENYLWHTARGGGMPLFGWRTRYWSFLLKLAKNR